MSSTITDVKQTRRGRVSVYMDGEFFAAVEPPAWEASGLSIGSSVVEEDLALLLAQSNIVQAKRRALHMLGARSYTRSQLQQRLARKTDPQSAEIAVERMEELGYIDDEDYATRYAQALYESKGYGLRKIQQKLLERGVSRELAEEVLESFDADEESERALALLQSKFSSVAGAAELRRATSLLERYGFRYDAVRYALREMKEDEENDW